MQPPLVFDRNQVFLVIGVLSIRFVCWGKNERRKLKPTTRSQNGAQKPNSPKKVILFQTREYI